MSGCGPGADLRQEGDGAISGVDVGVFVHLEGDLLAVTPRILSQLADHGGCAPRELRRRAIRR
jgi:hypothetical protein